MLGLAALANLTESELTSRTFAKFVPGLASAAFGYDICPIDGKYASSNLVCHPRGITHASQILGNIKISIPIDHVPDLVRDLVLKIKFSNLPDGAKWKENAADLLFESYALVYGGGVESVVTLTTNNTMCRAHGKWPTFNNNPKYIGLDDQWTVSIPIHTHRLTPMVRMTLHEFVVDINYMFGSWETLIDGPADGMRILDMSIAADGIYLESEARKACALATYTDPKLIPPPKPIKTDRWITRVDTSETILFENVDRDRDMKYNLMDGEIGKGFGLTYLLIVYTPQPNAVSTVHPIKRLEITVDERHLVDYDYIELEELNWTQCGLISPRSQSTLLAPKDFMYLVPFSKDFTNKYPTTWQPTLRNSIMLKFESDVPIPSGKFGLLAGSMNLRLFTSGMTGLSFAR
jgi:hypothetical protein